MFYNLDKLYVVDGNIFREKFCDFIVKECTSIHFDFHNPIAPYVTFYSGDDTYIMDHTSILFYDLLTVIPYVATDHTMSVTDLFIYRLLVKAFNVGYEWGYARGERAFNHG